MNVRMRNGLAMGLSLALGGCATFGASGTVTATASTPAAAPAPVSIPGVPDFVNKAYMNASEDVLIGIGAYSIGTAANAGTKIGTAMPYAQTRARADIARQLDTIVKNMVTDYTANSELDAAAALSFQENITQALAKAQLKGSKVVESQTDANGLLWVVLEYSKSAALQEAVEPAVAAAKLAVPAAAAFDALSRMDNAFDKAAGGGPVPVTTD